jgi:hypothetical protein
MEETGLLFDIIQVENWGSSIPGMASLSSEYLYTIEAMHRYIDMLTDSGILIIPRKLLLPLYRGNSFSPLLIHYESSCRHSQH